jgi:gamma-glutamyltranspeptidase/glutathione hydrolase
MAKKKLNYEDFEPKDLDSMEAHQAQRLAISRFGMVSTQHYLATQAGVQILQQGGNAIDAAVSAALALSVCEPAASGLGGQTMALIHLADTRRTFALDGSSRAPNRTALEHLERQDCLRGYKAATVPSTPAVLNYALQHYGTMKWKEVISPAIYLAENGYPVSELQHRLARKVRKYLRNSSSGLFFLREGKKTYRAGETFCQPVLANTMRLLAKSGIKSFYTGNISKLICQDMAKNDGLISKPDLAQIPWPIERRPVSCQFDGFRILTFPPPGAGRTLVEMLNVISHFPPKLRNPDRPESALLISNVIRLANRDRRDRPHDPSFYAQVSQKRMLSVKYASSIARRCRKDMRSRGDTTHLSVMDQYGNAVSLTQSIERVYGACAATPELGFLYNDYMSAFETHDISHPYYLRPNAVPWASVAPTIVMRGRKPWLVIGSPGSERIVSSILQVLLRLKRQGPLEAVSSPRLHCSLDGTVSLEASRMRDDIPRILEQNGFSIDVRDPYSFYLGSVQLVIREGDRFVGVADPRRDGSAGGPNK